MGEEGKKVTYVSTVVSTPSPGRVLLVVEEHGSGMLCRVTLDREQALRVATSILQAVQVKNA